VHDKSCLQKIQLLQRIKIITVDGVYGYKNQKLLLFVRVCIVLSTKYAQQYKTKTSEVFETSEV